MRTKLGGGSELKQMLGICNMNNTATTIWMLDYFVSGIQEMISFQNRTFCPVFRSWLEPKIWQNVWFLMLFRLVSRTCLEHSTMGHVLAKLKLNWSDKWYNQAFVFSEILDVCRRYNNYRLLEHTLLKIIPFFYCLN